MKKITFRILKKFPSNLLGSGIILILVLIVYGIVGSYLIMDLNLVDSIYYSITTMATVGYGDMLPTTDLQKIFATTLAIGGVGLFAYVFNFILTTYQEKVSKYSKEAMKMKTVEQMKDYNILCGCGRVGKVVFEELRKRNQNIILIEKNPEICKDIEKNDNVVVINEDATENELISKLAKDKCKSIIITTGNDVTNLFIVLSLRETNPDLWIVSRASKLENISRLKKAGADKIVSPELIGGKDLYLESAKPHLLRLTVRHNSNEILDEFKIISKYECTLENIEYHIPGIETPLTRDINTMYIKDGEKFTQYLNDNTDKKEAIDNLYTCVNNIHSHWISGPNKSTFEKMIKELSQTVEIIGQNLSDKEIANLTKDNKK